ncbi:MAG: hypothetical protein IJP81_09640 [Bacteroidales bacterium]|nr:hypothetical protein [Bacteroidales bacterium]
MKKQTEKYSAPSAQVVEWMPQRGILVLSNRGVNLDGAGVDEDNAEDNGNAIW